MREMHVIINGQKETIEAGMTIGGLLRARRTLPQRVAVEVNRDLVVRADYDRTGINEGDRIEIVTFVGGG